MQIQPGDRITLISGKVYTFKIPGFPTYKGLRGEPDCVVSGVFDFHKGRPKGNVASGVTIERSKPGEEMTFIWGSDFPDDEVIITQPRDGTAIQVSINWLLYPEEQAKVEVAESPVRQG